MSINRTGTTNTTSTTGAVVQYAGASAPTGWVFCDGTTYDGSAGTAYYALWLVIGTTYGGTGQSSFKVPDLRGRVAVGLDNMGGSDAGLLDVANTIGSKSGEQNHTLTAGESGTTAHNHTQDQHRHGFASGVQPWHSGSTYGVNSWFWVQIDGLTGTNNETATNIAHAGASATSAHNIMQPYMLLNYIIRT